MRYISLVGIQAHMRRATAITLHAPTGHGWFDDRRGERRLWRCWFDATATHFQRPGQKIPRIFVWDVQPKFIQHIQKPLKETDSDWFVNNGYGCIWFGYRML